MGISTNIVAGIDIGYGNLKVFGGEVQSTDLEEHVLPAGAAPVDALPRLFDRPDLKGGELVLLDGEEWVAGVDRLHIQNGARQTHENYSSKKEFAALFLAGLARLGFDHINLLVTGLPVQAFYSTELDANGKSRSEELKSSLVRLMQGRKHVNARLSVTIDNVMVVPQPFGTFMSLASMPEHTDLLEREDLFGLVVDPGYGTCDWVCMAAQSVMHKSSGSSRLATSHILEEAAHLIAKRTGSKVNSDRLDMVFRKGYENLEVGSNTIDYRSVLTEVGRTVGDKVADDVQSSLRNTGREIDYIILTGGGAWLYGPSMEEAFPKSRVLIPKDPVIANASGYFAFGRFKTLQARRRHGMAA